LDRLVERGMGWTDIALVAGVPVSAVRAWYRGGGSDVDSGRSLAALDRFLDGLEQGGIPDPVGWMEDYLLLPSGYTIRPMDLYLEGRDAAVLALADRPDDHEGALDETFPAWRSRISDWEVFVDTDGERSIRLRESR
jgi:hypothetical protein